jgi:hypothetical protein
MHKPEGMMLALYVFVQGAAAELALLFAGVQAFRGIEKLVDENRTLVVVLLSIGPLIAAAGTLHNPRSVRRFFREMFKRTGVLKRAREDILTGALHNYRFRFAKPADADRINELARSFYGEELAIPDNELLDWVKTNNASFRVVCRTGENGREVEVVGYSALLSLSEATYNRLKTYELKETDLKTEDLFIPLPGRGEVLYILDVAIAENEILRAALIRDLVRHIALLMRHPNNVKKVACWILTKRGTAIADALELRMIARHPKFKSTAFYETDGPAKFFSSASPTEYIRRTLRQEFEPEYLMLK